MTKDKIRAYLADTFSITDVADDASLIEGGHIDSMQALELAMFLDGEFGLNLDTDDMVVENFDSIASMDALVQRQQKA